QTTAVDSKEAGLPKAVDAYQDPVSVEPAQALFQVVRPVDQARVPETDKPSGPHCALEHAAVYYEDGWE
ncbi:MAG: hypothetical protein RLZ12_483, partial [Bacillota bacterium]